MSEPKYPTTTENIQLDAAFVAELTRTMSFHEACSKVWDARYDRIDDIRRYNNWIDVIHTAVADKWHAVAMSGAVVRRYAHNADPEVYAECVQLGKGGYCCIYGSTGLNHVQLDEPGREFSQCSMNIPGGLILRTNREELRRDTVRTGELPRQVTAASISDAVGMTVCSGWTGYGNGLGTRSCTEFAALELDGVKFTAFHGVCFKMELFDVKFCNGVIPYCVLDTLYGRYRITYVDKQRAIAERLDWTWLTFLEKELQEMGCRQVFTNGVLT